jgi:T-lymphocyte triggering factor
MIAVTKKQNHEREMGRLQASYEAKLSLLRNELELRRRAEIHEIEERKNEHINELIKLHERKFADMKAYYNQITTNNLDLIKSLKEEIANMKKNDEHNENLMYDIEKENHNLSEPLEIAKREVAELQQQLHNYEKDKLSLRNTRSRLKALDEELRQLQQEHEKLLLQFQDVHNDREGLKSRFEAALLNAMDAVQEKNTSLAQNLIEASAKVEERDAQLSNVLAAVNLEPSVLEFLTRQIEDTLETKNRAIKDLHFELKKIEKQHKDVLAEYERRCVGVNAPPLNLAEIL